MNANTIRVERITDTSGAPAETQNSFGFFMLCTISRHTTQYRLVKVKSVSPDTVSFGSVDQLNIYNWGQYVVVRE